MHHDREGHAAVPKVMIVDDDRTTVTLLQTLLTLDGFDVVAVPRGMEVLAQARRERPDVFLVDYHLSDMAGTQLILQLRADVEFGKTPIVMASGLNVENEAKGAGANVFLVKPFEPGNLATLFYQLLGISAEGSP